MKWNFDRAAYFGGRKETCYLVGHGPSNPTDRAEELWLIRRLVIRSRTVIFPGEAGE